VDGRREVSTPARSARIKDGREMELEISMPPNPSHLEAIDPVVEGMARAAGTVTSKGGAPSSIRPGACDPDPRRCRVPGAGDRRRDAEPERLRGYDTAARSTSL